MAEQKESTLTISKDPSYDKHKLILKGLGLDRVIKFNKGEEIQVTQEELETIGLHRWLIVKKKEVKDVKQDIKQD